MSKPSWMFNETTQSSASLRPTKGIWVSWVKWALDMSEEDNREAARVAALIESAPLLVEALEAVQAYDDKVGDALTNGLREQVKAAIAAARGGGE